MYEQLADQVLVVEAVTTLTQTATVRRFFAWTTKAVASYNSMSATLNCKYVFPTISGTSYQGQDLTTETRPMSMVIDDSAPVVVEVVNGAAQVPLSFSAPGIYRITVAGHGFGSEPAFLEVEVL